jgi:Fic family protein
MEIEAARAVVEHVSLPPAVQAELRRRARVRSTHYSTRIEGNRLTLAEAERVIEGRREALRHAAAGAPEIPEALRRLDARARVVLGLFARQDHVTATDTAAALGLSDRMARVLLKEWVEQGWIEVADPSRRARSYTLSAIYRQFIGNSSATPGEE